MKHPPAKYAPGARVHLTSIPYTEGDPIEYGIVVASWWNDQLETWDYYTAFFGSEVPSETTQPDKPYVLRYMEFSLQPGWGPQT